MFVSVYGDQAEFASRRKEDLLASLLREHSLKKNSTWMIGDRIFDFVRALLIALALALVWFESRAIIPAMALVSDVSSPQYHALHGRSTLVYGGVVLLGLAAIIMAAARREG